jgi:hypothetical protein
MFQTQQEVLRIVDDWGRNFCPTDMVQNESNGKMLLEYCLTQFGTVTAGGLTHAYNALRDGLELVAAPPAPRVKSADELAAEENARQHADYMKSIAPQESFDARVKAETAKKNAEKAAAEQAAAMGVLRTSIDGYQCYRENGGGIDYNMTSAIQAELRTVISRNERGQRDFIRNLIVVRQVIQELPDHPAVGDVARTLASINARQ